MDKKIPAGRTYTLSEIDGKMQLSDSDNPGSLEVLEKNKVYRLNLDKEQGENSSSKRGACLSIELEAEPIKVAPSGDRGIKISTHSLGDIIELSPPDDQHALKVLHIEKGVVKICLHKKKGSNGNINVLSIDGGGIRGIIPAMILEKMEHIINLQQTNQNVNSTANGCRGDEENTECSDKKCDCCENRGPSEVSGKFDLMAGTSTGAVLALGLSFNKTSDLVEIYRDRGMEIFPEPDGLLERLLRGIFKAKYSPHNLEKILKEEYFNDKKLLDAKILTMVTSYDINNRQPFFFKSWKEEHRNVPMWEAIRASSAAPTYFPPAQVEVKDKSDKVCGNQLIDMVDGGVFMNNPAMSAYAEAKRIFPTENITLVSIGTGTINRPLSYESLKHWGIIKWLYSRKNGKTASPLISSMMDGVNDAVDYQMRRFDESIPANKYFRLQIELKGTNDDMDDVSKNNIYNLRRTACLMMKQEDKCGNNILKQIIAAI